MHSATCILTSNLWFLLSTCIAAFDVCALLCSEDKIFSWVHFSLHHVFCRLRSKIQLQHGLRVQSNRGVPADHLGKASKAAGVGKSIRNMAQEFSIPLATQPCHITKKRDLIEQGSDILTSVGYKGYSVFTAEQELQLQSWEAAALYFGLPLNR